MAEQPISDIERVRRMLAGDEAAFEQFFADAYPALYRFALHTFRGDAALLTWLCAFCRHELYAWSKRHERVQVELLEDDPEIRAALESLTLWPRAGSKPARVTRTVNLDVLRRFRPHLTQFLHSSRFHLVERSLGVRRYSSMSGVRPSVVRCDSSRMSTRVERVSERAVAPVGPNDRRRWCRTMRRGPLARTTRL